MKRLSSLQLDITLIKADKFITHLQDGNGNSVHFIPVNSTSLVWGIALVSLK